MASPFDTTFKIGKIIDAAPFPAADKPQMVKLELDLGDRTAQSAAQLGGRYDPEALPGQQVICATNLGSVRIAGYKSEVLTVGVPDKDGNPVLVVPETDVPLGGELY